MYRTVHELNEEELLELKYAYHDMLQYTDDAETFRMPEEIPDAVVLEHYDGLLFEDEDFFCNCEDEDNFDNCGAVYIGI